jgi:hypothetical protein
MSPQSIRTHTDYVEEVLRDVIESLIFVGRCQPMLFPYPVEERNHPVVKDVKEFPERGVSVSSTLRYKFCEMLGQDT